MYRIWLQDGGTAPIPSTADQLRISYSGVLEPKKSLSDQITSLKFNPYDIKPILYPIDYVIYDGMEKGSIDNVIFLHNKKKGYLALFRVQDVL